MAVRLAVLFSTDVSGSGATKNSERLSGTEFTYAVSLNILKTITATGGS
jgi:hypothetical protein